LDLFHYYMHTLQSLKRLWKTTTRSEYLFLHTSPYFLLSRMLTKFLAQGVKVEVKQKQSLYRLGQTLWTVGVWGSQNSRQATDGGKRTEALQISKDVEIYRYDIHRITYDKKCKLNSYRISIGLPGIAHKIFYRCSATPDVPHVRTDLSNGVSIRVS